MERVGQHPTAISDCISKVCGVVTEEDWDASEDHRTGLRPTLFQASAPGIDALALPVELPAKHFHSKRHPGYWWFPACILYHDTIVFQL